MDHQTFLKSLPSDVKERLTRKSDAAGLSHLAVHGGLIMGLGILIALEVPFWGALILPQGLLLAFLFTLEHECTHKTPFKSESLNEWVGWATGLLIIQPFLAFRYFHLAHHRHTNDPEHDPELSGLPKPRDWRAFLWHLSSIGYWMDKARLLFQHGFGVIDQPYLPEGTHARLRGEALGMLAIYAAVFVFSITVSPLLLWLWLIPLAVGFPFLRLYLLAEHGRCPFVADMFVNTRTTYTSALVRFLAWNMPFHAEHHVYPQVPFYRIPEFHDLIRDQLRSTAPGYRSFATDYVSAFGKDPHR